MDPHHLNVKNLQDTKYDEFQVLGDDIMPKMASHNLIGHSTTTPDMPTSKTTIRRLRSLIWQYSRRVEETVDGKKMIKTICKYYKKILNGSTNGMSHLKRYADKCAAKFFSNVGISQS